MVGEAPTFLGIDLGTSSVKVVLTDQMGRVRASATAEYPVNRPSPDWAETKPEDWWRAVRQAVSGVLTSSGDRKPAAIGLSGQMHGVVLCTADGTPARPAILWADSRAESELDLYRNLPADVRRRLANPLSPGMAGPQLAWLRRHERGSINAAR